ncbi:MAG: cell wall-binding repeat-containing protein, partial [Firmicutes bacterium]|nr:cell wall-binding repeat-containing protein [Bacillota bacterium]
MRKWIRPLLLAIVLTALLLPAVTGKAEAKTVHAADWKEVRKALGTPHTTVVIPEASLTAGWSVGTEMWVYADDVVLDLNGQNLFLDGIQKSAIRVSGKRVKICNGVLKGNKSANDFVGILVKGDVAVLELENLTIENIPTFLRTEEDEDGENYSFGAIYMNNVHFTQSQDNSEDRPCIYTDIPGRIVMNEVTIESWDDYIFDLTGGTKLLMGNVTAFQRNGIVGYEILAEEKLGSGRTYGDYEAGYATIRVDGKSCYAEKELETGERRGKPAYLIKGTELESSFTKQKQIDTVALRLQVPLKGKKPDCEPEIYKGEAYLQVTGGGLFRNDIVWADVTDSENKIWLDPDKDTFQWGHTYQATIYLTPEPGYTFSDETMVFIGTSEVDATYRDELTPKQMMVTYTYTLPAATVYNGGEFTVDMTTGSTELTNEKDARTLIYATLPALKKDGKIRTSGEWFTGSGPIDRLTKKAVDLDKDGTWDVLVAAYDRLDDPEVDLQAVLYKLPTCSVKKNLVLALSEKAKKEMEESYDPYNRAWFSKVTFRLSDEVKASYKIGSVADRTYTGSAQKPAPTVKLTSGNRTLTLTKGSDYTLSYQNNVNAGTATVVVKGKDLPLGTLKKSFKILPVDLAAAATKTSASGIKASYAYTGKAIKPTPTVKALVGGATRTLKADTDYTVKYTNNINVGTATVTITGKGNFKGTVKKTFKISSGKPSYDRYYGADRYATSRTIADAYKKQLGVTKFSAICIADGQNYPDALAGGYFAAQKKAPILVVHQAAP